MQPEPATPALTTAQRWAFASVNVPFAILHAPALGTLPALYAKYAHLDLVFMGTVLTLARVLDCALDPAVGYASDRTRSRFGRRKPWIFAGAVVASVAAYFLFRPSPATGAAYFALWYFLLYLGWTLGEIPHTAWLSELSHGYDERSRLSTLRKTAGLIGSLMFPLIAFLPTFPTTDITPGVTAFASYLVLVLMPLTVGWALRSLPNDTAAAPNRAALTEVLRGVARNRPFWIYMASNACSGMASGMVAALFFFYLDNYLGIANKLAHITIMVYVASLLGTNFWLRVMYRIGKHRTLAICCTASMLTLVVMAMIRPGEYAFWAIFAVFATSAFCSTGFEAAGMAMMADIVDYDTLKTGDRRGGNYFAAMAFVNKLNLAAGGGVAFILAGLFGFKPDQQNGTLAMTGFFLAFIAIPILLYALAAWCAWRFPLDRRCQDIVRRRIERRAAHDAHVSVAGVSA